MLPAYNHTEQLRKQQYMYIYIYITLLTENKQQSGITEPDELLVKLNDNWYTQTETNLCKRKPGSPIPRFKHFIINRY